jgi:hypothetical protein
MIRRPHHPPIVPNPPIRFFQFVSTHLRTKNDGLASMLRNHSFTATGETPMRKLRLDVDTIAVDSFDLAETRPAGEGTVLAQEAVTTPCACTVCMTCSTCDLSCVDGGC